MADCAPAPILIGCLQAPNLEPLQKNMQLHSALAKIFGFTSFRPHQEDIVKSILAGQDSFTIMPTGGGKSLCYQLPAYLMDGLCVVVSPLISLMNDQVDAALGMGLSAATLNSTSKVEDRQKTLAAIAEKRLNLLYVSPERLCLPDFLAYLKTQTISFFAIDEAHCISQWGHDFRPDYLTLGNLAKEFPHTPLAAFTATATKRVAEDIVNRLRLRNPFQVLASFNRPNLYYQVLPKNDFHNQLISFLQTRKNESGIIYRTTRKNVDETTAFLQAQGFAAKAYHAGLPDAQRMATQMEFRNDTCPIIVATIAFGMGIDKSNVRFVVHGDLPKNMESYYQETGRAGRDGEPAHCALFYSRQDIAQLMRFTETQTDPELKEIARQQLFQMLNFTQHDICRRKSLLAYFDEQYNKDNCEACDICLNEVERENVTIEGQKALSAMVRTHCRFGAGQIIDVLTGAKTERIRQFEHDKLPTYGVGKDHPKKYWRIILEALINQGFAQVEDELYPVPLVTEKGWHLLKSQCQFQILRQPQRTSKTKINRQENTANYSQGLFEALRELRAQEAGLRQVPPYHIFSDRTLREMATYFPVTLNELLCISGIGQHKQQAWGDKFIAKIIHYMAQHPAEIPPNREDWFVANQLGGLSANRRAKEGEAGELDKLGGANKAAEAGEFGPRKNISALETKAMLDAGKSLEEIARLRGIKTRRVIYHMQVLVRSGHKFDSNTFFSPERLAELKRAFAQGKGRMLRPAAEKLYGATEMLMKSESEKEEIYLELELARVFL